MINIKKEVFIGFIDGVVATVIGVCASTFLLSLLKNKSFDATFYTFLESKNFWMLLALGALVNLLVFFVHLKKDRDHRARGVLLATFLVAFIAFANNLYQ